MTTPENPYAAFPVAPSPGAPAAPPKLRGRKAVTTGLVLLAVGIILVVAGGVTGVTRGLSKVDHFKRAPVVGSGSEAVDLDRTGKYVVYYESSSVADSPNQVYLIPVRLTNTATGATITPDAPFGNRSDGKIKILTYDQDGHKGVAMWQFDVAQAGTYKVESIPGPRTASDGVLAFGPSIESGVVAGGLLVVVGILAVVAALVTLVVGLVRRRRHKRQLRTAGPYGAAPGGYGAPGGYEPYEPGGPQPPPTEQPPERR